MTNEQNPSKITINTLEEKEQQIRNEILELSKQIEKQQISSEQTLDKIKLLAQNQQKLNQIIKQLNNTKKNEINNLLEQLFNQPSYQCHGPCKEIFYNPDSLIFVAFVTDMPINGKMKIDYYWICRSCFHQNHEQSRDE